MNEILQRGALLRDIPVRTVDGREVRVSDFRGKRNVVLVFPDGDDPQATATLALEVANSPELAESQGIVLIASDPTARQVYDAPKSALFLSDRYGEVFFLARHPEPLPDAGEILSWLEFIENQCPE